MTRIPHLLAAAMVAMLLHAPAFAADAAWPNRAIHVLMPGGVGGVPDLRARWLAERLAPRLGQSVIVENKVGAAGIIGMQAAAHSAPDGYTLVIIHQGTMTINPHLYEKLGYDPLADFTPITQLGSGPLLLTVSPRVPARSVAELLQLARDHPGQLTFGSNGVGTPPHLAGELFKRAAGIDVSHVPYKGGGQSVADLVAGHITFMIEGFNAQLPQVLGGRLRALAVTGPKRVAVLPDVPTMAQAGLPDYEYLGWVGIAAPAGTPRPIIDRLYREISAVLQTAEAHEWFGSFAADPAADPPEVFARKIRDEHAKWGRIIHDAGIRIE